jgi:hypothetical protein
MLANPLHSLEQVEQFEAYTEGSGLADGDVFSGAARFAGCTAIYDGASCRSCEGCEGGNGLKLDCTNIWDEVIIGECQTVTAATSFEFIPKFNITGTAFGRCRQRVGR